MYVLFRYDGCAPRYRASRVYDMIQIDLCASDLMVTMPSRYNGMNEMQPCGTLIGPVFSGSRHSNFGIHVPTRDRP